MSAKHALLGLLLQRPDYPYDLRDRLRARLGPAWAINSGHLYQTIQRLECEGLIERADGDVEDRDARRHVFAITDGGAAEFEHWFQTATNAARLSRRPLLVKITLAGPERLRDALAQIDAYELECMARLKEILREREEIPVDGATVRADHVLRRVNLSADVFQLEGELRWARHAREMLSWLSSREAIWPSAHAHPDTLSDAERDARRELFGEMAAGHLRGVPGKRGQPARGERTDD